jgi:hypothetical protein
MTAAELMTLADKLDRADESFKRVLAMSERKQATGVSIAFAAGMVLTLHGDLFAEAATALRAHAQGERP